MTVLILLGNAEGCIIVENYVDQLDDEELSKYSSAPVGISVPVVTFNNSFALQYGFAAPSHSYGGYGAGSNV
jgi:hypothetical protein